MKIFPGIALSTIDAFRGVVDFYYWKGQAIARAWPSPPRQPGTPAQIGTWNAFRDMMHWIRTNPTSWHRLWNQFPTPPEKSPEDVKRTMGLRLAYGHALNRPPDVISTDAAPGPTPGTTRITVQLSNDPSFDPLTQKWLIGEVTNNMHAIEWTAMPTECPTDPTASPRYQIHFRNQKRIDHTNWDHELKQYLIDVDAEMERGEILTIPIHQDAQDPAVSAPIPVPYP